MHQGEDRSVSADSQRNRQNDGDGKSRRFEKRAESNADALHGWLSVLESLFFLRAWHEQSSIKQNCASGDRRATSEKVSGQLVARYGRRRLARAGSSAN